MIWEFFMRLNRWLFIAILATNLFASDNININFKDLKIMDFVKITSKIINKNINRYNPKK